MNIIGHRPLVVGHWINPRQLNLIVLGTLLLALWPGRSGAQAQAINWQIVPGFDGAFKAGAWFPVTITVSNSGPDVSGTLSFRFRTNQAVTFSQPLDLPHNANKRIVLPVLADSDQNGNLQADVTLRTTADAVVQGERINLNALNSSALVLGVVSDEGNALPELTNIRGMDQGFGNLLLRLTSATLPDRAELLQSFDALFVHAVDTSTWTDAQRAAIGGWLSTGGHLIVGGDTRVVSGLADLLPATVQGADATSSLQGLSTGTGWKARAGASPVPVLRIKPQPGAEVVLRGDDDLPLIVRQRYGVGSITQAAFDLQLLREAGDPADFWPRVVPLLRQDALPWSQFRQQGIWMLQQALELPALRLPSVFGLLGFLLLYIMIIGPINYLLLRRFDRREWAYVTIPLLVLLFSGGAYLWGSLGRGRSAIVSELAVVRAVGGATEGQATSYLTLFSPTRYAYDVALPEEALVTDLQQPWQRQGRALDVVYAEDRVRVPDLLVDVGAVRVLSAEQTIAVPQVEATTRTVNGQLQVTLRNRSDQPISDMLLVRGDGRTQAAETLEPGADRTIVFSSDRSLQDQFNLSSDGVIDREVIVRELGNAGFPGGFGGRAPVMMNNGAVVGMPAMPPDPRVTLEAINPAASALLPAPEDQLFVLGWQSRAITPVTLGEREASAVGDTLYIWAAQKEQ